MYLENINSPQDLKKIPQDKLPILAKEIRDRIIEVVSKTGGHLASSLGAVELAIALHYCLNSPEDKIIWDVGHQSYAHKMLTGRKRNFQSLRQYAGISGFPTHGESVHDIFTTGHSSTAVSLALGLVCARDLLAPSQKDFKVVAVIGDGSLSGGLCFEGLNNAGHLNKDILVVLNTNELSISANVGALSNYINKIISMPIYNRFRAALEHFITARLPRGERLKKMVNKFEEGLKGLFIPGVFFEELGFRYFGPLDGHNLDILIAALRNILSLRGPRLVHVVTQKGKGYAPAEKEPVRFHSTGPFKIETGERRISHLKARSPSYTEVFGSKLLKLAQRDNRIVAITAAMPEGTGLDRLRNVFPGRFFDVGIAEEHAVCFSAGLAKGGFKPVVAIYSTFLQRAYDQIIEEVALQNLPVVFCLDRAGIVGEDGLTHQGLLDLAYLRNIPNMVLMAPRDHFELEAMLEFALSADKPVAIRYPKGQLPIANHQLPITKIQLGKAEVLREGNDIAIIAIGSMVIPSLEAADLLKQKGLSAGVVNARFVKPLDKDLFKGLAAGTKFLFTVEEGVIEGGFGSAVLEALLPGCYASWAEARVHILGLPCKFMPHGKREILLEKYGLTAKGIASMIVNCVDL
jgi:1-deoxy-D-xylulose-5-phosphate synthase